MIADTAIIHPYVELGKNVVIEDYCIIGVPLRESKLKTVIGDNAHIRSHTVIYAGNIIGENFVTGNRVNIRELNQIGSDVSIGTATVIEHHLTIEDGVRIHSNCFVPEFSLLEAECWLGPGVYLTNAKYPRSPNVKSQLRGPTIGRCAKLGANSTILPDISIGENALVGAGSVVTSDVAKACIVAGNPARVLRQIHY